MLDAEHGFRTSGLASTAAARRKRAAYEPSQQWGLRPEDASGAGGERQRESDGGGATYVVQGHVLSKHARPVAESMGREEQAKAARKRANRETEKMLQSLAGRDEGGMRAVVKAREKGLEVRGEKGKDVAKGKAKGKAKEEIDDGGSRKAFSASVIKTLGFDPTAKARQGLEKPTEDDIDRKVKNNFLFRLRQHAQENLNSSQVSQPSMRLAQRSSSDRVQARSRQRFGRLPVHEL